MKLSAREFDQLANQVWSDLLPIIPLELKAHFDKIQIRIEDFPPFEVLQELAGTELEESPEDLCGLHIGTPLPEHSVVMPVPFPAIVYLFRKALADYAEYDGSRAGRQRLREEITVTLLHEIGHFFGLTEDDLERLNFG